MNWEWAFLQAALLGKPRIDQRTEVRDPLFPLKRGSKNTSACDSNISNMEVDARGNRK